MTTPNVLPETGFNDTMTTQVGGQRREFQAFVPHLVRRGLVGVLARPRLRNRRREVGSTVSSGCVASAAKSEGEGSGNRNDGRDGAEGYVPFIEQQQQRVATLGPRPGRGSSDDREAGDFRLNPIVWFWGVRAHDHFRC